MNNKILIIGANGMLGSSLLRYLSKEATLEVLGTVRSLEAEKLLSCQGYSNTIREVDIIDFHTLRSVVMKFKPAYVLNCVGVIKQLEQSKAPVPSIEINSLFPHRIAKVCDEVGARLIHFSTDCVFSGIKGMYVESDIPDATDLYGRSKLLGEVDYGKHLTLRTSIIGHELGKAVSFVDWFLRQKGSVNGYRNAVFSGMPTVYVAEFLQKYVFGFDVFGLYHLGVDSIDKYSLLKLIGEHYEVSTDILPYDDFKIDRSLNSERLNSVTNFVPPSWDTLIQRMRREYLEYFA